METHGGEEHQEHDAGLVELSPQAAERAGIRTAPVVSAVLEAELTTTGRVDFDETRLAHVSPRLAGRVHRVAADLGQRVGAGELLATIDSIELGQTKAEYLQARAREEFARENLEREERLFADGISAEQKVLSVRTVHREAIAALASVEETLHLYGISQGEVDGLHYDDPQSALLAARAPFAGKVVEKHVTLGELVSPERNLFTLADLSRVWIWIDVYERDLAGVHLGDDVEVRVEAWTEKVFRGRVSYLSDQVDPDTRALRARIDVDNPREHLRPGMFARVHLTDPHGSEGRLAARPSPVVPESALQRDGGLSIVFVPQGEHRYRRRVVEVGRRTAGRVEILTGLVAGEEVVVEGAFVLKSEASKEKLGAGHEH